MGRCFLNRTYRSCSKNCAKQKRVRFCDAVLFGNPLRGFAEKLLDIKTARFYGKVFVEQDLPVLFKKLKSFFWKKGKHKIKPMTC